MCGHIDVRELFEELVEEVEGRQRVQHTGPVYRIVHEGTITRAGLREGERPLVFSYGGGLDSFWTLVMILLSPLPYFQELRRRITLLVHSDLGAEWPETTWHLYNVAIPLMRAHGYDLTIIHPRQTARDGTVHENITDYYMHQGAIPTKSQRSCTPRFKIGPCVATSTDLLGTADYQTIICYDAGEGHRTDRLKELPEKDRERLRTTLIHPPMAMGRFRPVMEQEIAELGFPVPPKSACTWCIFSHVEDIHRLHDLHPELLEQAIALEENVHRERNRTDICILHMPLRRIRQRYILKKEAAAKGMTLKRKQLQLLLEQAGD